LKEHVTEYGVHWNFFITLGLLPPFVTILKLLKWKKLPFSVFAAVIILVYQWALNHFPIRGHENIVAFIVTAERTDLFSQNREGIFSFFGLSLLDISHQRIFVDIPGGTGCWRFNTTR